MTDHTLTVQDVVGRNARAIRSAAGATITAVAKRVTALGLPWSDSRVSALERGKVAASLQNLVILAAALGDLRGTPVRLSELLAGTDDIEISKALAVPADDLRRFLEGMPTPPTLRHSTDCPSEQGQRKLATWRRRRQTFRRKLSPPNLCDCGVGR